jgi:hypothetical protein
MTLLPFSFKPVLEFILVSGQRGIRQAVERDADHLLQSSAVVYMYGFVSKRFVRLQTGAEIPVNFTVTKAVIWFM